MKFFRYRLRIWLMSFFDDEPSVVTLMVKEEEKRHNRIYRRIQFSEYLLAVNYGGEKMSYTIVLEKHPNNDGRWGKIRGKVTPRVGRVSILVFSHDERWYNQKPAVPDKNGCFETDVAFGNEPISDQGREYVVVAYVGPGLPTEAVYESLNDLPAGYALSAPLSVRRTDNPGTTTTAATTESPEEGLPQPDQR
jgi:hypothetical protein